MENLPGARQERFTAEETDVLVRAVKDQEVALYGDGRNPSKLALVKRAWEEIATIVSTAGIPRTSLRASGAVQTPRCRGSRPTIHAMAALSDRIVFVCSWWVGIFFLQTGNACLKLIHEAAQQTIYNWSLNCAEKKHSIILMDLVLLLFLHFSPIGKRHLYRGHVHCSYMDVAVTLLLLHVLVIFTFIFYKLLLLFSSNG